MRSRRLRRGSALYYRGLGMGGGPMSCDWLDYNKDMKEAIVEC